MPSSPETWPPLALADWIDTCETLHRWTQVVGKIRMALAPAVNHWWHVPLYVTARGLTTTAMPCPGGSLEIAFDFVGHQLTLTHSNGTIRQRPLRPESVASFYAATMAEVRALGVDVKIWPMPSEIPSPVRFDRDEQHASYDAAAAARFWRVLLAADRVMHVFRSPFIGKHSPVHFFWGSFDLASTRFSGRRAPERPGADQITREAYSHEVMSVGFWAGTRDKIDAAFYAYAAPEPDGLKAVPMRQGVQYSDDFKIFVYPYADARAQGSPDAAVLEFFQSVYDAAADLGRWDRAALERRGTDG